jgi:branched-chain amino acid transport system ATP-binding protein
MIPRCGGRMWGPDRRNPHGAVQHAGGSALVCEDVSIGYGDTTIVRDVNLRVEAGKVLAIVGPNGAGKSTLLNGIVGLAKVMAGQITFDGARIGTIRPEEAAARRIAYVPQGRWLFPYASGALNVWSGGFTRSDRGALADDIDRFFSDWSAAGPLARKRASYMSGGQQQVIAIGRALMAHPRLLLLDEPSLGLAPILVKEVFAMLASVASGLSSTGTVVVLVEQNVEAALHIADEVCVLAGGRVVHHGPRGELSASDIGDHYLH